MHRTVQFLAVWLTFVSMMLSGSGLGPALAAGLAELDGQHEVTLEATGSGMKVLLHHEASLAKNCPHKHGVAVLLALAGPSDDQQEDHVICFSSLDRLGEPKSADGGFVPPTEFQFFSADAVGAFVWKPALAVRGFEHPSALRTPKCCVPHLRIGASRLLI